MSSTGSTEKKSRKKADTQGVVYRKPRANVFTVLLVISLLALILGITFLWLDMAKYEYKFKDAPRVSLDRPVAVAFA